MNRRPRRATISEALMDAIVYQELCAGWATPGSPLQQDAERRVREYRELLDVLNPRPRVVRRQE